jgi:FKBP-type peptidyl-prolyl cis-trans isomerase SlyD
MKGVAMNDNLKVKDGQVVSMEYTLRVDNEVIDTSEGHGPLEYIQGIGNIIPGLEREMEGMTIGQSKDVVIAPIDAYGELDPEAFADIPRDQFPSNVPLEKNIEIQFEDQDGNPMHARIDTVGEQDVRLDFNHPLAGKELYFSVKVVGLRDATDEELDHGHVHVEGHHH